MGSSLQFFKQKIERGDFTIIDKALEECKFISNGIIINKLVYLGDAAFQLRANMPHSTGDLLPPNVKKFYHYLEYDFVNSSIKKSLTKEEFEAQKQQFLKSADIGQILFAMNIIHNGGQAVLVTDETKTNNDNKLFKKIPAICDLLKIPTKTLPEILTSYIAANFTIKSATNNEN